MGSFPDEDEPFLDECWDSIIGGKENKTDCEDVEIEKLVNVLERWMTQVLEKRGQNECHVCAMDCPTVDSSYSLITSRRYSMLFSSSGTGLPNPERWLGRAAGLPIYTSLPLFA